MKKISIKGPIVQSNSQWIYDWLGMEAASPKSVNRALEEAHGEPVDVEINSGGGEIMAASEIYTALRSYSGGVRIHIVGLAASAASVIAMAGRSDMTPTGMMMIHNVQTSASGDYREMEHNAEVLRLANQTIASAYRDKTGKSEEDILRMMDTETWVTAEQAVALGLVDCVMELPRGAPTVTADFSSGMLDEETMQRIRALVDSKPGALAIERAQAKFEFLTLKGVKK